MAKIRLYTLAKELGVPSKDLLSKLQSEGFDVSSALSSVEADAEAAARRLYGGAPAKGKGAKAPAKAPEKAAAKPAAEKGSGKAASKRTAAAKKKTTTAAKASAAPAATPAPQKAPAPTGPHGAAKGRSATPGAAPKAAGTKGKSEDSKVNVTTTPAGAGGRPQGGRPAVPPPGAVTVIPDDETLVPVDPDLDQVIERKNRLLDIEESLQRRMGRGADAFAQRKKIVRVAEQAGVKAPVGRTPGRDREPDPRARGLEGRPVSLPSRPGMPPRRGGPAGGHSFRRPGGGYGGQGQGGGISMGRKGRYKKKKAMRLEARAEAEMQAQEQERQTIRIGESMAVGELATFMNVNGVELVRKLLGMGVMASLSQRIDFDTATLLATEYGFQVVRESEVDEVPVQVSEEVDPSRLTLRPPVVTVMGHVDHGKTSLLDAIRKTNVVAGESGGITQHIGAYQVTLPGGQLVTFLDTPGHEAFTAMRAHGAQVTDIAVLVVAADDGVKPQTVEALQHAKAAGVPIIVALNKMDKEGINIDRVYQELSQHDLQPEDWGGKTICVKVSAKQGTGIDELLEMIVLQAEMMEVRARPDGPGDGVVIESRMDKGRGPVATVLVREGQLKVGDAFVAGAVYGRIRAMEDYRGARVEVATPATPVEIMGFNGQPDVADPVLVCENEQQARQIAERRSQRRRQASLAVGHKPSLEELLSQAKSSDTKEIRVVLRADVQGSVAAVGEALSKLSNEEGVRPNVVFSGTGTITESDVMFAAASEAIVIGFHVRPPANVQKLAASQGVEIRLYSIIYKALEDMQDVLNGMLKPKVKETILGSAEVREIFSVPKIGRVAGCYVTEGVVQRNAEARVIRDGVEIHLGKVASVRRFKDDAREVAAGYECGIRLESFQDVQVKDVIEVFKMEEVARD